MGRRAQYLSGGARRKPPFRLASRDIYGVGFTREAHLQVAASIFDVDRMHIHPTPVARRTIQVYIREQRDVSTVSSLRGCRGAHRIRDQGFPSAAQVKRFRTINGGILLLNEYPSLLQQICKINLFNCSVSPFIFNLQLSCLLLPSLVQPTYILAITRNGSA